MVRTLLFLLCLTSPAAARPVNTLTAAQQPTRVPEQPQGVAPTNAAESSEEPKERTPEAFRLRIVNSLYGPVEISLDRGKTWMLVARVMRRAQEVASGGSFQLPMVERAGAHGMAFGVGRGKLLRLLPDNPQARTDRAAIYVNVRAGTALFKHLLPPSGSPVQQELNRRPQPLPAGYSPQDNDVLLLTARVPSPATGSRGWDTRNDIPSGKLSEYAQEAAERYKAEAFARLRKQGRKPATGILTINARLAPGDTASAVTFLLNGDVSAILNHPPYSMRWDTREWPDGEHLIEVRALDKAGTILTQAKKLVVVNNRGDI